MTSGVKPALGQQPTARPNVDRQASQNRAADRGFGDALGFAKTGKQDAAGKPAADVAPRWIRFGTKLDAAIDRTAVIGEKQPFVVARPAGPDREEKSAEDDLVDFEGAEDQDHAETSNTLAQSPMPGLHFPLIHVQRILGKDGGEDNPGRLPAGEDTSDATAAPEAEIGGKNGLRPSVANRSRAADATYAASRPADSSTPAARPGLGDHATTPSAGKADIMPTGAPEPKHADASKIAARATILSEQNFVAPMPATAVVLVEKIAADGAFLAATDRPVMQALQTQTGAASAHSLNIQLHPAELGTVTASLRLVGEQLSIELQVDTNEAYQRLSADSESLVTSLRGLGYDIERVTVLPPQVAVNAAARPDANASVPGQAPRGGESFGSDAAGAGSGGTGGQRAGGDGNDARHNGQKVAAGQRDRAGGGLYI